MQFHNISIFIIAVLAGVAVTQNEAHVDLSTTQFPPEKLNPTEDEVFPQVYGQFLAEEMHRQGADYAEDERDVLNGAISWSMHQGRDREVEALQRIKTWKEKSAQSSDVERRSPQDPDSDSTDDSIDDMADPNEPDNPDDPDSSDDEQADAEDDAWVNQFMNGQLVDENLLWRSPDLTDKKPSDSDMMVNVTSEESKLAFWLDVMRFHTQWAFSLARYRSRLASNSSAVFEQDDKVWATNFVNGEPVDENMIFSMDDLQIALDEIDTLIGNKVTSVAVPTTATATLTSPMLFERGTLTKRHPPRNAVQYINRILNAPKNAKQVLKRALRKARHRARKHRHVRKPKHHKHKVHKHKSHGHKQDNQKHHDHKNHQHKNPQPKNHKQANQKEKDHKAKHHNDHKHHNNHDDQRNQHKKNNPQNGHNSNQPCWRYNRYYFCFVLCYQQYWGQDKPVPTCIDPSKGG